MRDHFNMLTFENRLRSLRGRLHRWRRLDDGSVAGRCYCRNNAHAVKGCMHLRWCVCRCGCNMLIMCLDRLNIRVLRKRRIRSARRVGSNGTPNMLAVGCVSTTGRLSCRLLLVKLRVAPRRRVALGYTLGTRFDLNSLTLRRAVRMLRQLRCGLGSSLWMLSGASHRRLATNDAVGGRRRIRCMENLAGHRRSMECRYRARIRGHWWQIYTVRSCVIWTGVSTRFQTGLAGRGRLRIK